MESPGIWNVPGLSIAVNDDLKCNQTVSLIDFHLIYNRFMNLLLPITRHASYKYPVFFAWFYQ